MKGGLTNKSDAHHPSTLGQLSHVLVSFRVRDLLMSLRVDALSNRAKFEKGVEIIDGEVDVILQYHTIVKIML